MQPCTHDNRIFLYQPQDAPRDAIVWCRMCGASGRPRPHFGPIKWRLPEREKWHVVQGVRAPEPASEKPIELELNPSELQTLAKWAHVYLATDPKPLVCPRRRWPCR